VPATPPAPLPAAPSSETAPSDVSPKSVRLTVTVIPRDARIFVDGKPVGRQPYLGRYPADAAAHQIRAEAPGFVAMDRSVALDEDKAVELALEPVSPAVRRAGTKSDLPSSARPPGETKPPGKPVRIIEKEDPYK
jgi:serine/threonine-protein kinase